MSLSSELRNEIHQALSLSDVKKMRSLIDVLKGMNTTEADASIHNMRGAIARIQGSSQEALEEFDRALALYDALGEDSAKASVSVNAGIVHIGLGNLADGLAMFQQALAVQKQLGNKPNIANITCNIGVLLQQIGDYKGALPYLHDALMMYTEQGNQPLAAIAILNIGAVHSSLGDVEIALEQYQRALDLHIQIEDQAGISLAKTNIARCYIKQEKWSEARQTLDSVEVIVTDDPMFATIHLEVQAKLLINDGKVNEALEILMKGLKIAEENSFKTQCAWFHLDIRNAYKDLGDFDKYVEHNDAYLAIKEELQGQEIVRKIAVQEKQAEIELQRREQLQLKAALYSALPSQIADRVVRGEAVNDQYEHAAVMFIDIVSFTEKASSIPANDVVKLLDTIFSVCDSACSIHGVTKIKTIGDSYLAVAFPAENETEFHVATKAAHVALDILERLQQFDVSVSVNVAGDSWRSDLGSIEVRIGVHSGPLVAGILGSERLQYDVWGDTVNLASRMESSGESGKVQVSEHFALCLANNAAPEFDEHSNVFIRAGSFEMMLRGTIEVKGKGEIQTWWLSSKK